MFKVSIIKLDGSRVTNIGYFVTKEQVDAWILENESHQAFGELGSYDIQIEDCTLKAQQEKLNQEALEYLASTDWYVIRAQETGTPVPSDVLLKRQAARLKIVK